MFVFNGKNVATVGELLDAAVKAMEDGEAGRFLDEYRAINEFADANLGYVFGYLSEPVRSQVYAAYGVKHPIFGAFE